MDKHRCSFHCGKHIMHGMLRLQEFSICYQLPIMLDEYIHWYVWRLLSSSPSFSISNSSSSRWRFHQCFQARNNHYPTIIIRLFKQLVHTFLSKAIHISIGFILNATFTSSFFGTLKLNVWILFIIVSTLP